MLKRFAFILLVPLLIFPFLPGKGSAESWQDETIYYVMIDRFYNGNTENDNQVNIDDLNKYQGGDLKGVISKLDYIKEMGFTAIAFNPVIQNMDGDYTGNSPLDFMAMNENYGTIDELKELVKEAHHHDMKVILDFQVNHLGKGHPWLEEKGKENWFHEERTITETRESNNQENGWVDGKPDLAQENPEVASYLIDAAKWWAKETDIDGYRLLYMKYVPKSFWNEFIAEMKKVYPEFYLLGELDAEAIQSLPLDGVLDKGQLENLRKAFATTDREMDSIFNRWDKLFETVENPHNTVISMDTETTERFTKETERAKQFPGTRWKMALTYLYTMPGIPMMTYGSEIALNGGEKPDNHRMMNFRTDEELIEYITKLSDLRQEYPALAAGDLELLQTDGAMAVFKRETKDQTMIVAINNSSKTKTIQLDSALFENNQELRGKLNSDLVREQDGLYGITLDRETAEVYLVEDESGLNIGFLAILILIPISFVVFLIMAKKKGRQTN
ncbi:alpha-amlyase [Pradoshia eiseniae]|uniref:alpha-amylase n=1 Tax=Pradoshia eiseniae TaxID=2064768 RepID=A0A2S7N0F6_9BACI|nr:alpha-amylase family glycosyl hydrolase [Pradoshia eiseniae]PQD95465.1 alpha-amlyase [Pradoshia eiseniae]